MINYIKKKKQLGIDILYLALLIIISLLLTSFLLKGNYWSTGYEDWIYHAFRVKSLEMHGLTSWDHVWVNGMQYWKAYQLVPFYFTLAFKTLFGLSITKAMVVIGVLFFILLRVIIYSSARLLGFSSFVSFLLGIISLDFVTYWTLMKDYTITFGVIVIPFMLVFWKYVYEKGKYRELFVVLIGLLIYIHPLATVSLGGLWLFSLVFSPIKIPFTQILKEIILMVSCIFFYAYGLYGMDTSFVAPYQLSKTFIVNIGKNNVNLGIIFNSILVLSWLTVIVKNKILGRWQKVLLAYSTILLILIQINLTTDYLNILNKFQIIRCTFFIVIALLYVFGSLIEGVVQANKSKYILGVIVLFISIILGRSLTYTVIYAPYPVEQIQDPVKTFLDEHNIQPVGSLFIDNSFISTYNSPNLKFNMGYNEHLLPNLLSTRLKDLLTTKSLTFETSPQQLRLIHSYVKFLGTEYIFLNQSSPLIDSLTQNENPYELIGKVKSDRYIYSVLKTPWVPRYAVGINKDIEEKIMSLEAALGTSQSSSFYKEQDSAVQEIANIKFSDNVTPLTVEYPTADSLKVAIPPGNNNIDFVYLSESYSKGWREGSNAAIERSPEGMMIIETKNNIYLKHTWGETFKIQYVLWTISILYALWTAFRQTLQTKKPHI